MIKSRMQLTVGRAAPALIFAALVGCGSPAAEQRQAEVAEAGRAVMPFDLEATTHIFEKVETGGIQRVVVDTDDAEQVALVRSHLTGESQRFARGDFHDPAMIHGADMPGLHMLVMGHDRVSISYREIERGGEITYESAHPELVQAIHLWFDAQVTDHGDHAQSTH